MTRRLVLFAMVALGALAQTATPQYLISTITGGLPAAGSNGTAISALLRQPQFAAADAAGNLYFSEFWGFAIRKVSPSGALTTVIGTGFYGSTNDGQPAASGAMGTATGLTFDAGGNLYFVDNGIRVRKTSASGVISTVAGTVDAGFAGDGGPATAAQFNGIQGITFDQAGNLYIADTSNHVIRKVTTDGNVNTVAGTGRTAGFSGDGRPAAAALLNTPSDVTVDAGGTLYIADRNNNRIRAVSAN